MDEGMGRGERESMGINRGRKTVGEVEMKERKSKMWKTKIRKR